MYGCFWVKDQFVSCNLPPIRRSPHSSRNGFSEMIFECLSTLAFFNSPFISFGKLSLWVRLIQYCSACWISSVHSCPLRFSFVRALCTKRCIHAVILKTLLSPLYLFNSNSGETVHTDSVLTIVFWTTYSITSSFSFINWGSVSCVCAPSFSHSGPCHQSVSSWSAWALFPRVPWSAGFSFPEQCFQFFGNVRVWISLTRFSTNGFHCLELLLIQWKVIIESVQNCISVSFIFRLFAMNFPSLAPISAPINSNLGSVIFFSGATLVLDAIRLVVHSPFRFTHRR